MQPKADNAVRILAVGDIIGRPGRRTLSQGLRNLRQYYHLDGVVVNVENAAGGFGMTREIYDEFCEMDLDCMTSGNHIFDKKGYDEWMSFAPLLLRPENFPPGSAGKGYDFYTLGNGVKIAVLNLIGRTFMKTYDCPFRAADAVLDEIRKVTPIILVDFHAEATSEKMGIGWYLAGRVSCLWGTHTHVPTADARILKEHTGYLTDLGMTGPYDSIIGMVKEPIIEGFITLARNRFEVAKHDCRLGGAIFDIDTETGRCLQMEGLFLTEEQLAKLDPYTN